jgi:pyruvate ferredoxin oxidoreductase alpha subunit
MADTVLLEGNAAVAFALKQINPDVVAAYPITPATEVVQEFSTYVANGEVDTEFVAVESEHSAMSACIGAAAAGGRVMTGTSSQGLALMWECLYLASSLRFPIVMAVANRALSGNINIHCDHGDGMGARDTGWIQIYCENTQEIYDNCVQAPRIAEHMSVRLPVMVCFDGFVISHAVEVVDILEDKQVRDFVGPFQAIAPLLDIDHPRTIGPLDLQDYYFEHKRGQIESYAGVPEVVSDVGEAFGKLSGRPYGLIEEYRMEDAEAALVMLGSTAGTTKDVVDTMRDAGHKVGLIKIRMFRPFPAEQLVAALSKVQCVGVMDRHGAYGTFGAPLFTEIRSALYGRANMPVLNFMYGLGGREITMAEIEQVFLTCEKAGREGITGPVTQYVGVRE